MPQIDHKEIRRWSTGDVPQAQRLDYFAAAIGEALYPIAVDRADPRTFRAEVSFADLGAIEVCKASGSPIANSRGRKEVAATGDHRFNILMTLQSAWRVEHRGSMRMLPRDVLIIDSEHPTRVAVDDCYTAVNVVVPDVWLRQWLPNPNLLTARRIPGNSLWGLALSSYVSELSPDVVAAPPLPLSVIADQVGSLLALTASGMHDASLTYTPAVRSLLERIHECLAQRCMEWELTAAEVAACIGISVRTLHRTLAAANETFGDKLIEAKARVALRMLKSPLFNRVTTAEIGRRAGFPSASHFARVMRNRTGRTPLELRHAAFSGELDREA
ncbi:helix-turn-helix transcriptional regulator [Rhizobium mesoamericanum]|uniref:helix-turn-helix transcriptional regulator n=1 Tax=Rhizobium mesoamericanum TaxID=1079800 RepID=UPI000405AE58|nr:AraC family transcriptional regulator [Rhizobium mesoamericanum]